MKSLSARRKPRSVAAALQSAVETLESRLLFARLTGIDVSSWQPNVNWNTVHKPVAQGGGGKDFAYVRASYGLESVDTQLDENTHPTNGVVANGMYLGFYHFAYYDLGEDHTGNAEADHFFDTIKPFLVNNGKMLQPVLDVERPLRTGWTDADLMLWVQEFCARITSRGQSELGMHLQPLIYSGAYRAGAQYTPAIAQTQPLWVAQWPTPTVPDPQTTNPSGTGVWQDWAFWQYAADPETGQVGTCPGVGNGTTTPCDLDVFNGDENRLRDYVLGSPGRWNDGARVQVNSSGGLKAWSDPTSNTASPYNDTSVTVPNGTFGTVLQGPVYGNGYMRWQIQYDNGVTGWSAVPFLNSATPGLATNPNPPTGAGSIGGLPASFAWTAATNATSYDVYLDGVFKATVSGTSWLHTPIADGAHTWRVDPRNQELTTTGTTWSFNLQSTAPGVPSSPNHNGDYVNTKPVLLDWADTPGANTYDIYFGTNPTPTYVDVVASEVTLASPADGLRLWRVVAKNNLGSTSGPQWSYTMDSVVPTATFGGQTPVAAATTFDFTLSLSDLTSGINPASLDNNDVTVTGPNAFNAAATFISFAAGLATYRITAPGGTWNGADNGTYSVIVNANQIKDLANNAVTAGTLSTFVASTSIPLPGVPSNPNHNGDYVNLKPLTLDWDDAPNATSYDVYLGTSPTPTYANLTVSQITGLNPLDGVRLWRVVAKNAEGATTGPQWSYTMDTVVPTASLGGQTPANGATFDFTLTYADATSGIDSSTFDNNDVTVTGPGGYSANATFISNAGNVATYRITSPGGAWDSADNGTYTVSINGAQVKDLANNSVAAGSVGTFNANLSTPAFAWMTGSTLNVQFDGTTTPITLATLSGDITATRDAVTLNFSGVTDINVIGTASNDSLQLAGAVAPPLTFSNGNGQDSVELTTGSYAFASNIGGALKNVAVTVASGASATFNATQHLRGLTVAGDATLSSGGEKVLVTGALAITGQLDLTDNDLVVDYSSTSPIGTWSGSSYDGVTGLIASGRNGGGWDGVGIVSSLADLGGYTTLGVASAAEVLGIGPSDTALFGNVTVDGTSVLVKYTYGGDANLSGSVDVDDYGQIDFNASTGGALTGFLNGDFDYNGLQDVDDYGLIDFVVNIQGPPL